MLETHTRRKGWIHSYGATLVELSRVIDSLHFIVCLGFSSYLYDIPWGKEHFILSIITVTVFSLSASSVRLYRSWRTTSFFSEMASIFICWFVTVLVAVFVIYLNEWTFIIPDLVINTWFQFTLLMLVGTRAGVRLVLRVFRVSGRNIRTAAILGATEIGQQMGQNLQQASWMGINLLGIFDDRKSNGERSLVNEPMPVKQNMNDLIKLAESGDVDLIYVALPLRAELRIKTLIDRLMDTTATIYFVPDFSTFDLLHSNWDYLGGLPGDQHRRHPLSGSECLYQASGRYCVGKHYFSRHQHTHVGYRHPDQINLKRSSDIQTKPLRTLWREIRNMEIQDAHYHG